MRQLSQLWRRTKQEGLPESDINAARRKLKTEVLYRNDSGFPFGLVPQTTPWNDKSEDRSLLNILEAPELSPSQINLSFIRDLDPKLVQTVIVTDASGELLKALTTEQSRATVEIISYDAFL